MNSHLDNLLHENINNFRLQVEELIPFINTLNSAMRYSLLSGGKCLRSFIINQVCKSYNGNINAARLAGCAVEMMHAYSLIHDDLPCIDNDDFRRGVPSCHKKFGEATALIAGDGLLTLAFEILSSGNFDLPFEKKCKIINIAAQSIGKSGMILGQDMDLRLTSGEQPSNIDTILLMQQLKTGEMFAFCFTVGGIIASQDYRALDNLKSLGYNMGAIFQIKDDIDDYANESTANNVVNIIGLEKAKQIIEDLYISACNIVNKIPNSEVIRALLEKIKNG